MREAGKCGVGADAVRELLGALGVAKGSAVYVAGQSEGLEPLAAAYRVRTQRDVLTPADAKTYAAHPSFRALLDAALAVRADVYVARAATLIAR